MFNISKGANGVDPDKTAPIGAVLSGSTLFVKEASNCFSRQQKNIRLL